MQLRKASKLFKDYDLVSLKELDEIQRKLKEKEVLLSFYGHYNAGKSTLINALLQNR